MRAIEILQPGPGQESVWSYPRPPALRRCEQRVRILFDGELVADTVDALCVLETSHPPSYYLPREAIQMRLLQPVDGGSFCEWKGRASYFDLVGRRQRSPRAAWTYPDPATDFRAIENHLVFYAHAVDACYVGEFRAQPQPGRFYGGWGTPHVTGPFKGGPGTEGW